MGRGERDAGTLFYKIDHMYIKSFYKVGLHFSSFLSLMATVSTQRDVVCELRNAAAPLWYFTVLTSRPCWVGRGFIYMFQ